MKVIRLSLAALLLANPALAQQTQKDSPPPASAGKGTDTPGGSATNGVITPPAMTDPRMTKRAPENGTMPIMPPNRRSNTVPK